MQECLSQQTPQFLQNNVFLRPSPAHSSSHYRVAAKEMKLSHTSDNFKKRRVIVSPLMFILLNCIEAELERFALLMVHSLNEDLFITANLFSGFTKILHMAHCDL